jgi:hypothetical protein
MCLMSESPVCRVDSNVLILESANLDLALKFSNYRVLAGRFCRNHFKAPAAPEIWNLEELFRFVAPSFNLLVFSQCIIQCIETVC